ncbi:hypothetical protein B0H63DRAFT_496837 [Podospora didyma]|uniref:Glucose-methanol-choline oxidoreductase C-terminal domain-containing protein n=1 Tax=Podospora didyma TaxID=330526 RepID=A0AAE0K9Z9_9PEZI|nr:hypothetical protein B0H63DRAFT_496837 [Podospora didyma]
MARVERHEVLIVGSGPIGAVFARGLVDAGKQVLMIDIGEQATRRVGDHKKNSVAIQKDISLFTKPNQKQFIYNGQNPNQNSWDNLPVAAATRVVGGMGSHWTCCTPREHPDIERPDLFSPEEWDALYAEAEKLFWTNSVSFEKSIRQQLVKHVLANKGKDPNRKILSMPLSCKRSARNKDYVEWGCAATILGDLSEPSYRGDLFTMKPNTQCIALERDAAGQILWAVVKDLLADEVYHIEAKKYVITSGAVLTPGILYNSGFAGELPALGHYLTEQPMAFCQVVLDRTLVDTVVDDPYHLGWTAIVEKHQKEYPHDPLPFPFNDYDPQVYYPLSKEYPWHTQIHRDAFGYGEVPAEVDQRLIVDFRWFGYVKPQYENCIEFTKEMTDEFGMPQPTFHFRMDQEDADRCSRMITDMVDTARNLGGFLAGAEPKYLPPGSSLHICGTYRAGFSELDSVVNKFGKVHRQENLVLGGCGVIPTQNACNPTLTAACFALAAVKNLVEELNG